MLDPRGVDLAGTFGVVGSLSVGEEGFLGAEVVETGFEVAGLGRFVAGRSAKLLENLVFTCLTHYLLNTKKNSSATHPTLP